MKALTDTTGNVVASYDYDAWGNLTTSLPLLANPFTYTGREYDRETSLYYYRARYYDPKVGRFISEDPIGLAGGINLYSYVENNPVNFVDPLGLQAQCGQNQCNQSWAQCYTNCIDYLDPIGNLANRLANSVVNRTIHKYIGSKLPTRGSQIKWGGSQAVARRGVSILAAWQAGTSYGCMISCAMDPCNY